LLEQVVVFQQFVVLLLVVSKLVVGVLELPLDLLDALEEGVDLLLFLEVVRVEFRLLLAETMIVVFKHFDEISHPPGFLGSEVVKFGEFCLEGSELRFLLRELEGGLVECVFVFALLTLLMLVPFRQILEFLLLGNERGIELVEVIDMVVELLA
jgi:hypothetical protein